MEKLNDVEEKIYYELCYDDVERKWAIYKNFQKITENIVNEMVYNDIKLLTDDVDTPWVTINLDTLYNIKLDHLKITKEIEKKTLPKSDEDVRKKIMICNIIITSLYRNENIFLYNKQKDDIEFELKEKIKYTKGYLVCIKPVEVKIMKKYEYYRKAISDNITEIKSKQEIMTVEEYLDNKNYSKPIWIKNDNIVGLDLKNAKILNNTLKENINVKKFVENINFLNQIKLSINKEIFEKICVFIEKNVEIESLYMTKNKLIENIYKINENNDSTSISEDVNDINIQKMINSASMLEIMKKQVYASKYFYINNCYDGRLRIYADSWPVNYQLNHIIRSCILIEKNIDINGVYDNFEKNNIVKENYIKCEDSLINKLEENTKILFKKLIKDNMTWKNNIEIKEECLIMVLNKIAPKEIKNISRRIDYAIENYNFIKKTNIVENWKNFEKQIKTKKNKIPYMISAVECIKKIEKDIFNETYWLDASSNAVQLITLRMGCKNNELLKLTNIIDNDTEYENIYDYTTEIIKNMNKSELTNDIKITNEELSSLIDKDDSKYLIMPACYGMGKYKYRKNREEKLKNNEIWQRLNKSDKNKINDYLWSKTFEILENMEFDLIEYKNICNSLKDYDVLMWKNDIGMDIAPVNTIKSKRQDLIKKINSLKIKIKNKNNEKEKINNKIDEIKKKLTQDDKDFWKRSMITITKNKIEKKIFIRIPKTIKKIDKRMTLQALTPNTIHAYDASIIFLCIQICKELGIKILVIHDCIGCQLIYAPLVKKIFKIVNIEILKKNIKNKPFPLNEIKYTKEEIEKLAIKILESTNFFR